MKKQSIKLVLICTIIIMIFVLIILNTTDINISIGNKIFEKHMPTQCSDKRVSYTIQSESPYSVHSAIQYPIKNINQHPYNNGAYQYPQYTDQERIFNPLRYPYKRPPVFNQSCDDGQLPITNLAYNTHDVMSGTPEFDSINRCVTSMPINVRTQGGCDSPSQVGVLTGSNNEQVYPLFGRKKYRNDEKYEYYTMVNGAKLPVKTNRNWEELQNGDITSIIGLGGTYTTIIYDKDSLEYTS
jgi:hypothetical protein